jgi:hypothetical protein
VLICQHQAETITLCLYCQLRNDFLIGLPITPNDREKIEFHFRNDLPVKSNFQMFTSCIGAFRLVYRGDLRVLPVRFPHNFHFSAPFPAMAKPRPFRASDFTPRATERIAAEMRAAHDQHMKCE